MLWLGTREGLASLFPCDTSPVRPKQLGCTTLQGTWVAAPSPQPHNSHFTLLLSHSFISAKHLKADYKLTFIRLWVKHMPMRLWMQTQLPSTTDLKQCWALEMTGVSKASHTNQELRKGVSQTDKSLRAATCRRTWWKYLWQLDNE